MTNPRRDDPGRPIGTLARAPQRLAQASDAESAAREEGFKDLVLGATLPGEPLYRSFGFREVERFPLTMPDGVSLEMVEMERPIEPTSE